MMYGYGTGYFGILMMALFFLFIIAIVVVLIIIAIRLGRRSSSSAPTSPDKDAPKKFCTKCGAANPPEANYCISCGEKL
jgi:ribosomal protein L40E